MAINANDIVRVTLQIVMTDLQTANVVRHYKAISGTAGDAGTILTAIADQMELALNQCAAQISSITDSFGAIMWKWNTTLKRFDGVASEATTGFSGTNVTDPLPAQMAAQVDLHTDVPRRQGRIYIAGFCEDFVTDGQPTGPAIVQMLLTGLNLALDVVASGITLSPGVFNTDPASPYFESFELLNGTIGAETYMATQRRRKPGVGI